MPNQFTLKKYQVKLICNARYLLAKYLKKKEKLNICGIHKPQKSVGFNYFC